MSNETSKPQIAIIGAGFAGLCMGIQLKRAGIDTFTILEKGNNVGGTWRENTYPGAACDVASHLYSFSFELNPDWSCEFSGQDEILNYLEHCARKYQVLEHIRFNTEVREARFDEDSGQWRIQTADNTFLDARYLVSGTGQLNRPSIPDIPGLDDFKGVYFHSANWRHDVSLEGKRVAAIGNGATAVQFVPEVAKEAEHLTVFQRSAHWIVPRGPTYYSARTRRLFRSMPLFMRFYRWKHFLKRELNFGRVKEGSRTSEKLKQTALQHLERNVPDPDLREKLTPDYIIGCKRILIADDYYPALMRENVTLETNGIERVENDAIVTSDGSRHPVDALIFATGFAAQDLLSPIKILGRGGQELHDVWGDEPEAYLGTAMSGFPNLFMIYGPNTNLGTNSVVFMIECQVNYIIKMIKGLRRKESASVEVKAPVQEEFNERLQEQISRTSWAGGCRSWYMSKSGKVVNNWSSYVTVFWWKTLRPNWSAYTIRHHGSGSRDEAHVGRTFSEKSSS